MCLNQTPGSPACLVRCPGCGKQLAYASDNPARPFCSLRCHRADLAAWASESYRVDAAQGADPADDTPAAHGAH